MLYDKNFLAISYISFYISNTFTGDNLKMSDRENFIFFSTDKNALKIIFFCIDLPKDMNNKNTTKRIWACTHVRLTIAIMEKIA